MPVRVVAYLLLTALHLACAPARRPMQHSNDAAEAVTTHRPGVLLITVDALRADHLGIYGYRRATSPVLDHLADRWLVYERAYTTTPHTAFALASLLTGGHALTLARFDVLNVRTTLAAAFHQNGYQTAAFFPPAVFFADPPLFAHLERTRFGFAQTTYDMPGEDRDAVVRADQIEQFIASTGARPFFAWAHVFAPHEPYVKHDGVASFGDRPVDRYDDEIRWVDRTIGPMIERVVSWRPDTIVVVTADHGEEFNEHGGSYHGTTLYEEQIHIPLLIRLPGTMAARIDAPVSLASVAATVLQAAGLPPAPEMEPALPLARDAGCSRPVVAENATTKALMVAGSDKLLTDIRFGWRRVFDLQRDPGETNTPPQPSVETELLALLTRWMEEQPDGRRSAVAHERALVRAAQWDRSATTELAGILSDDHAAAHVRVAAARALGRFGRRAQVAACRQGLHDPLPDVRRWCAVALARHGQRVGLNELRSVSPGRDETELVARAAIARLALRDAGAATAAAAALPLVNDIGLGCELVDALAPVRDESGLAALVNAYEPLRTRACVARALAAYVHPATSGFLRFAITTEPYAEIQVLLIEALTTLRDAAALPVLASLALTHTEPVVRVAAAKGITAIQRAFDKRGAAHLRSRWRALDRVGSVL